jgi:PIN domain nuclease of toxin-antitoxin system
MMALLLDTHVFVWLGWGDPRLSKRARDAILLEDEKVFVSVITRWELALKERRFGPLMGVPFDLLMARASFEPLDLRFDVPSRIAALPDIHKDPFDRILVAQALSEGLTLVTADRQVRRYPVQTLW